TTSRPLAHQVEDKIVRMFRLRGVPVVDQSLCHKNREHKRFLLSDRRLTAENFACWAGCAECKSCRALYFLVVLLFVSNVIVPAEIRLGISGFARVRQRR